MVNICQVVLSDGWGGAEAVAYELVRHLRDKGENVSLIVNQEIAKHYADLKGVNLFSVGPLWDPMALSKSIVRPRPRSSAQCRPSNRIFSFFYAYSRDLLARIYAKRVETRVRQFLSDNQVQVLHAHLQDSIFLISHLDSAGIPRVATLHGEYALRGMSRVHPLMLPLVRCQRQELVRSLAKMDRVTHVSRSFMHDSWDKWGDHLKAKSVLIVNGVNLSKIRETASSTPGLSGDFNLLFPGGAKFLKGGDLVIDALAKVTHQIPGIHLYIALDVPPDHLLRRMVRKLDLEHHVTFVGLLPRGQYQSLLNSVDALVMPSREEAFGMVYIEAMALGKPVIASVKGGAPEIVKNGRNGILVQPDPDQTAEAILHLYQNEGLRDLMSQNNLRDAARFDWGRIADDYLGLYRAVLAGK